jgi:hypothetical protein
MKTAIWVHDAMLSAMDVAFLSAPQAGWIYVFDEPRLQAEPPAFHRLQFIADGLTDLYAQTRRPVMEVHRGEPVTEIVAFLKRHGYDEIITTDHPAPEVRLVLAALEKHAPLRVLPRDRLVEVPVYYKRFSRYWERHARDVLGYSPPPKHRLHK